MIFLIVLLLSAALCSGLIVLLRPLLIRYALARPNARSSHKTPTPQGGGIAILLATLIMAGLAAALLNLTLTSLAGGSFSWGGLLSPTFLLVGLSALLLAIVGIVDDIRPLPAAPRLVMQACAVAIVVLSTQARLLPFLPFWIERGILIFAGLWFVNLVNFMDGLDWITVAEMVPITGSLVALHWWGFYEGPLTGTLNDETAFLAAALCGALIGFAPFNRPVARLFLGDVGSLPIGLLVGWLLLQLAGTGALVAALLLPLYYLMDATITLLRRLARHEKIWEAHRTHFYQKATDNGFSALAVSAYVFGLNLALVALATITLVWRSATVQVAALAAGVVLVALVLRLFSRPRSKVA